MAKVCENGLIAVGNIACNNADNQIALRDHIDVIVRALGQHIDNAEVGSSSVCVFVCKCVLYVCTRYHCDNKSSEYAIWVVVYQCSIYNDPYLYMII